MDRGPMALFGAIVAVGLGPAMWLGAQFGATGATPSSPPAVTSEQRPGTASAGTGGGAGGSAPQDPSIVLQTRPHTNDKPVRSGHRATPTPSAPGTPRPGHSSTGPAGGGTPTPSSEPSSPAGSTGPTDPPIGGGPGGGGQPPPSPPATDQGTGQYARLPV